MLTENPDTTQPFDIARGEPDTAAVFSKVLLVEDDDSHVRLISRALRGVVGEVVVARSGSEAFEILSSVLPELVLCDLRLPDFSGLKVLETIREVRPGLPLIFMTSSSQLEDAVAVMRAGAWDYMVKEFNDSFREQLQLVITRCAKRKTQEMRELQIRSERDAFSAAVRSAPDGLSVLDRNGDVVFANNSFYAFCAQACRGELADPTNIIDAVSKQDCVAGEQLSEHLKAEGRETLWRFELKVSEPEEDQKEKDPSYFELMLNSIVLGSGGDIPHNLDIRRYVLWVRDITAKKQRERFQRDLLATTSHDLKGPLGAILTSVDLLEDFQTTNPERATDLITRIGSCARNCVTLIDELLSARRIQDGVLVVRPHPYKVSEALEDVVLDYLPVAKSKPIELFARPLEEHIFVYADKMSLHRVLSNLVSNAIKFTPAGGRVELSAAKVPGATQISVSDNGCGIEAETRPKLFQRYSRLDKHQNVEGTGLGLFVAKNIMDAHDGRIEVRSEVGVGTTFVVTFPDQPEKPE